jgi:hypothetical protein
LLRGFFFTPCYLVYITSLRCFIFLLFFWGFPSTETTGDLLAENEKVTTQATNQYHHRRGYERSIPWFGLYLEFCLSVCLSIEFGLVWFGWVVNLLCFALGCVGWTTLSAHTYVQQTNTLINGLKRASGKWMDG